VRLGHRREASGGILNTSGPASCRSLCVKENMKMNATRSLPRPIVLTTASAISAAVAALSLAACGPRDVNDTATLNGTAATQTGPGSVAPVQGTPVPAAPTPAIIAAPVVAPGTEVVQRPVVEAQPVDRSRIGSVESIEPIRTRPQGSGAGAVVGGVLGAVVGHQFGSGVGRAAMTGLGAAGGAVAGNNVERNHNESISGYRVSVRLDNGSSRTFERSEVTGLQVGDRVRLDADSFHRF
jgi:outer membrane lipoprotein SlyB